MRDLVLPQPVLYVMHTLQKAGYEAYVVGGAVRDVLLDRPTADWDFTTNAKPDEIRQVFAHTFYDNDFGTVGVASTHLFEQMYQSGWEVSDELKHDEIWQDVVLEITTFRKEYGYSDKRRPDHIVWGDSIEEDLARRDFTINAMAITAGEPDRDTPQNKPRLNGVTAFAMKQDETKVPVHLVDIYDGFKDLKKGLIRSVGDSKERFREDALRMMRAIRFGAQLAFVIEHETMQAVNELAELIDHISWERKRDEFLKILASDFPADGVLMLYSSGLLNYLIPEMLAMRGVEQGGHHIHDVWKHSIEALRHCPSSDPIVRLAALLHDIGKPKTYREQGPRGMTFYGHEVVGARMVKRIGQRLRLSNKQIDKLFILVRWHMFNYDPEMTDGAIRRFIRRVGVENINDMMLLRVGDRKGSGSKASSWRLRELQERIGENLYEPMSVKDLNVDGHDVMEILGIKPGPEIGEILNQLFEEVMEESEKNDREYLLNRIEQLGEQFLDARD